MKTRLVGVVLMLPLAQVQATKSRSGRRRAVLQKVFFAGSIVLIAAAVALRNSQHARLLHEFTRRGGRLVLGSDAGCCGGGNQIAGLASHHPIHVFVRMGLSPLEAIRTATLRGATLLGVENRTGSIHPGKEADLLIVRGNPADRIEDLEHVELVFAKGIAHDPRELLQGLARQVGWP